MSYFIDDDYAREISANYWREIDEMKMGIHPSQVKERIEELLTDSQKITFLDWDCGGTRVRVSVNNSFYGVFDYETNEFESTPESRLSEETKDFELNMRD